MNYYEKLSDNHVRNCLDSKRNVLWLTTTGHNLLEFIRRNITFALENTMIQFGNLSYHKTMKQVIENGAGGRRSGQTKGFTICTPVLRIYLSLHVLVSITYTHLLPFLSLDLRNKLKKYTSQNIRPNTAVLSINPVTPL